MSTLFYEVPVSANTLQEKIEKLIVKSGLSRSDLGLAISDLSGEVKYHLNADQKMAVASLSKIPTAIAALEVLGPTYEFSTQVLAMGEIEDGHLKGDLYLKGKGEPAFVSERMWFLVNSFTRSEIKTIDGDLIVDESYFDDVRMDKDRLPPSEGRAFDAPVSALSFNWNSVNVFIRPGPKTSTPGRIYVDPINDYVVEVVNQTKTVANGEAAIEVKPLAVLKSGEFVGDKIIVSGAIPIRSKEVVKYRSISQPDLWTGANFKEFLRQRGIVISGRVKRGKASTSAKVICEEPGGRLSETIVGMMKFSNNFVAEMITKNLAVHEGAAQGNLPDGMKVIVRTMAAAGLSKSEFGFVSPSGLSKGNMMTANQIVKLLKFASRSDYSPEFWSSFPLSGRDGTIKSRMKGLPIRAKTGLLTGVSGLAGMISLPNDNKYLFSFVYNGKKYFESRDLFDQIATALAER